jgi:hypothetical protein
MEFNKSWSILAPGLTNFTDKFRTETKEGKIGMEKGNLVFFWGVDMSIL